MKLPDDLIPLAFPPYRAVYLASPYTHDDPEVRKSRFHTACRITGELMNAGLVTFSPIAHSHPIAQQCDLPTDWKFWEKADRAMLMGCGAMIVLTLPGWEASVGIKAERALAEAFGIPVWFLNPHTLEFTRREEGVRHD